MAGGGPVTGCLATRAAATAGLLAGHHVDDAAVEGGGEGEGGGPLTYLYPWPQGHSWRVRSRSRSRVEAPGSRGRPEVACPLTEGPKAEKARKPNLISRREKPRDFSLRDVS